MNETTGLPDALGAFLTEDCPECGTPGPIRHLSAVGGCGTCAATDPRPVFIPVPVRDVIGGVLSRAVRDQAALLATPPAYSPWTGKGDTPGPDSCYRARAGFTVHVKPGCRCR